MKINVGSSVKVSDLENADLIITVPAQHIPDFKLLVARGTNTWDSAPAAIKEMHDLLYHGKILQRY